MKRFRKIFLSFLALLFVVLIIALVVSNRVAKIGLPQYEGEIEVTALSEKVEIRRDTHGTPHIIAQNEQDLYTAVGYVMAQDRLWQMDLLRRVTLGRLSEIFGDDFVETDLLLRSLEYSKKSKELLKMSPEKIIEAAESFAKGVNEFIKQNEGNFPLEFKLLGYTPEKWEAYHSLNLIGYMAWDLKSGWNELIYEKLKAELDSNLYKELLPNPELFNTAIYEDQNKLKLLTDNKLLELSKLEALGADILFGSNNWAVSGKKSSTGAPILANDMHLGFSVPGIWMQMHQTIPGKLNVSGLAIPGQPLIIVGHNEHIAWGMTNTYVDNLDYYEEKINPENSDQYEYNGQWLDFTVVHVEIKSSTDSVFNRIYKRSHRGPVVSDFKKIKGRVLSIRWVGDEMSNEILSIYKVNRAQNWKEFKDAFRTFKSISQNIAYADVEGNIGLYACAGVPVRKRNPGFEVLPGWTDEYDWTGMIDFDDLPYEFNPERGFVSSANTKPTDETYPYHIGTWYSMPYRMERIQEMLQSKEKLSVEDFKMMQNDYTSTYAMRFIEKIIPEIQIDEQPKIYQQAYAYFNGWEGNMDKDLVAPALFEVTMFKMLKNLYKDRMGDELFELFMSNSRLTRNAQFNILETQNSAWLDDVNTNDGKEEISKIATRSFLDAVDYLVEKFRKNPDHWKWGNLHQITLEHPLSKVETLDKIFKLNRGPFRVSGSFHTIAPYSFSVFKPGEVTHGASHRHIYSLENWDNTQSVIPTGNSGHVKSEFYMSQTEMFINGEYYNDLFTDEAIREQTKYKLELVP